MPSYPCVLRTHNLFFSDRKIHENDISVLATHNHLIYYNNLDTVKSVCRIFPFHMNFILTGYVSNLYLFSLLVVYKQGHFGYDYTVCAKKIHRWQTSPVAFQKGKPSRWHKHCLWVELWVRSNKALQNDLWDLCGHEYIPIIIWIVTS